MFGLGMPEILMILAIALIVIGPQKLPELAKTLGRAMGEFKRSAQDFKNSIDMETTVKDFSDEIEKPASSLRQAVKEAEKEAAGSQQHAPDKTPRTEQYPESNSPSDPSDTPQATDKKDSDH